MANYTLKLGMAFASQARVEEKDLSGLSHASTVEAGL
jgi:hypothetical protein